MVGATASPQPALALRAEPQAGLVGSRFDQAQGRYSIAPITGRAALAWISKTHRHLPKLQGALFAVGVERDGELVGVATAGNPARVWQGTGRVVITRCAAKPDLPDVGDHAAPVCTMLYGALCRAARALGYREVWTYTLPWEAGVSLRAAGFTLIGETSGGEHSRESRPRVSAICPDKKLRWMRHFGDPILATEPTNTSCAPDGAGSARAVPIPSGPGGHPSTPETV
jgi:hypothetical protein